MKTIITAVDKAVREGVYTLEEISIILTDLDALSNIVQEHQALKDKQNEDVVTKSKTTKK